MRKRQWKKSKTKIIGDIKHKIGDLNTITINKIYK